MGSWQLTWGQGSGCGEEKQVEEDMVNADSVLLTTPPWPGALAALRADCMHIWTLRSLPRTLIFLASRRS